MKKILLFFALMLALCCAVSASQPGFVIAPSQLDMVQSDNISGDCIFQYGEDYLLILTTASLEDGSNGDPYFVLDTDLDAKYEWIRMRVKNASAATQFEMHFGSTANEGSITASSCTHYPITSGDSEYKEYIFNVKEANLASQSVNNTGITQSVWSGKISKVRFDCMWMAEPSGQMPKGSEFYIDYIAFFDSEQAAKDYVPPKKEIKEKVDITGVVWDKNSPHFIMDNAEEVAKWTPVGASVSFELGNMKFVPTSDDPQLTRSFEPAFAAESYPFFAYRYKAKTTIPNGGFFFITDEVTGMSGVTYTNILLNTRSVWTDVVLDMREQEHGKWKTNIYHMRLDAVNGTKDDGETEMFINRMGFFRSEAEAYAFLSEGSGDDFTKNTFIWEDSYKTVIPGGTLSEGYNENDYRLDTSSSGNVVTYTDAQGNTSIVALGYTNEYGHTTYVANKAGKYALGTNNKEYTDISSHWGKEYIDFVSQRALFGGTSPTEFSPDMAMTRGMFITVLGRMHGVDTSKYMTDTGYTDVPAAEYYAPYIKWAKDEGIMAGTSDTTFAPETPITRADMAVAIKNYTENSGFSFTVYAETEGFNDLAGLDETTVNAINTVKNVGIVGGKGEGRFDPHGISTRAEVATVMQRVIKTILGVNVPQTAYTNEYITRDRIRLGVWSFEGSFATPEGMKDLADLGIDVILNGSAVASAATRETVLNYADVYGIEVYMQDYYKYEKDYENIPSYLNKKNPSDTAAAYAHHPSFAGHYFTDEPGTDHFEALGDLIDYYESSLPGKRAYANLLPMYANAAQLKMGAGAAAIEYYDSDPDLYRKYCEKWVQSNNSDFICVDIYPLNIAGSYKSTYRDYVESINQVATVARENGKEFWCCIQTYGWQSDKRTPNEAEYRWQCYCLLSFGATGIMLWQYRGTTEYPSLVDLTTLKPTQAYYDCKPVMWEMRNLSDVFVQYKNLGAFTHNATKTYQKMSGEYKDFDTIKSIESDNALLIGCFEKKDGSGATAFTVVNMEEFNEDVAANVKINLDPSKKITIYNRAKPTAPISPAGEINLTLPCGEGVFITVE